MRAACAQLATAAILTLAACGGGDDGPVRPLVAEIRPAIAAVEAELGGPQRFFEVNATPQVVNLFVATGDGSGVTPFVFVGGELAPAGEPSTATGNTFAADALTFDADNVLAGIISGLPGSDIVLFTVLGGPDGAVQYTAGVQSSAGGALEVVVGPDGAVQAVDPGTS